MCLCGTAGGLLNMCGCDGACLIGIARTVGDSHSLLLFHSPASIFRTEACKDMHAFSSVRVLRKRRVFINQSGKIRAFHTLPWGGGHSKFPTIEPFSLLTFSKVRGGKGGFPKGTASCYRSPNKTTSIKIPCQLWWWGGRRYSGCSFSPLHHISPVPDVRLWRVCEMDKYSLQTVFYWFHVSLDLHVFNFIGPQCP